MTEYSCHVSRARTSKHEYLPPSPMTTDPIDLDDADPEISREAEVDLLNDVQRDAARTQGRSYDQAVDIERMAEAAEAEVSPDRLHNAY